MNYLSLRVKTLHNISIIKTGYLMQYFYEDGSRLTAYADEENLYKEVEN